MVSVSVENKGAYCCLGVWIAGHSQIVCNENESRNEARSLETP